MQSPWNNSEVSQMFRLWCEVSLHSDELQPLLDSRTLEAFQSVWEFDFKSSNAVTLNKKYSSSSTDWASKPLILCPPLSTGQRSKAVSLASVEQNALLGWDGESSRTTGTLIEKDFCVFLSCSGHYTQPKLLTHTRFTRTASREMHLHAWNGKHYNIKGVFKSHVCMNWINNVPFKDLNTKIRLVSNWTLSIDVIISFIIYVLHSLNVKYWCV